MHETENYNYVAKLEEAFGYFLNSDSETAISRCEEARQISPQRHEALFILGLISVSMENVGMATKFMEEGHKLAPECKEYADALAFLFSKVGKLSDSLYFSKLSLTLEPEPILSKFTPQDFGDFRHNMEHVDVSHSFVDASVAFHEREYATAVKMCERELMVNADNPECQGMLGQSLIKVHKYERAVTAFKTAIALEPDNADNFIGLANALRAQGNIDLALKTYREAKKNNPNSVKVLNCLVLQLAYCPDNEWQTCGPEVSRISELLANDLVSVNDMKTSAFDNQLPEKINVAYLVNEWAMANNADFLESALRSHQKSGIRSRVYQQYSQPFKLTDRLKCLATSWREVYNIDDETLAFFIKRDAIHVLVDMCGMTHGNRQRVLAAKPAPVRVCWLGFPTGSIAATTNFLLSCDETIDVDKKDSQGVECFNLGAGMFCYSAGSVELETDDDRGSPFEKNGYVTFGGILDMPRVVHSVEIWAEVLKKVDNARLLVGGVGEIHQTTRNHVSRLFADLGVADRVQVLDHTEGEHPRTKFLSSIDILLDTVFVNGVAEICDALWMGVPVISLRGGRRTARMGSAILASLGRKNWIANDSSQYISISKSLASDNAALSKLKKSLRQEMRESTLCNQAGFSACIEDAYKKMLEKTINNT